MASPSSTRVYRIVSSRYPPFDGSGTYRWGSRWISPGRWVVHAAETYALAVLENLVHWQTSALPPNLVCVTADIPDSIEQEELDASELPLLRLGDYEQCRAIGDDWYERAESAVLRVPSVVSPHESNLLINQCHRDFPGIAVQKAVSVHVDSRPRPKTRK